MVSKKIELDSINHATRFKGVILGWGIRWLSNGWLYNVTDFKAIDLNIKTNKRIAIGCKDPNEVLEALKNAGVKNVII